MWVLMDFIVAIVLHPIWLLPLSFWKRLFRLISIPFSWVQWQSGNGHGIHTGRIRVILHDFSNRNSQGLSIAPAGSQYYKKWRTKDAGGHQFSFLEKHILGEWQQIEKTQSWDSVKTPRSRHPWGQHHLWTFWSFFQWSNDFAFLS